MENLKEFISNNSKWKLLLEVYIRRIETFKKSSFGQVVDGCKCLIESILKTIIVEVQCKTEEELKKKEANELLNEVVLLLRINTKKYEKIIGGCNSIIKGIAELRNTHGETSHGKDIYTLEERMNSFQNIEIDLIINSITNLACFILKYYEEVYPNNKTKQKNIFYSDNDNFNGWLDEKYDIVTVGTAYEYSPSEVLFNLDSEAYKQEMLEYQGITF